jgi:hypothetical protein
MLRILLLFAAISFNSIFSFGQKKYLYYLDGNLKSVEKPSTAKFKGVGFYRDDKFELTVTSAKTNNLVFNQEFADSSLEISHGLFVSYYPNGVVEWTGSYDMGKQIGLWEKNDVHGRIADSAFFEEGKKLLDICYQYDKRQMRALKTINDYRSKKFSAFYFDESGNAVPIQFESNKESDIVFLNLDEQACYCGRYSNLWYQIEKDLVSQSSRLKGDDFGTLFLQFVVDKNGNISDVIALNKKETILAKVVTRYIRNSPPWQAGLQNGEKVNSYRLLHYTFKKPDLNKTSFPINIAN